MKGEHISLKLSNLFQKQKNPVLESISTYQQSLIKDIDFHLKFTYNEQPYIAKPTDWDKNIVTFEAPMVGLDYVFLPSHLNIEVSFISKSALFSTSLRITKNYHQEQVLYYVAEIVAPIIKKQRRETFRLNVNLDVQYQPISMKQLIPSPSSSKKNGVCTNISAGGMCLSCHQQLQTKDTLQLHFTLMQQPLSLVGEVLSQEACTGIDTYLHRIRFIGLDSDTANRLSHLIFEQQRLQLKKTK